MSTVQRAAVFDIAAVAAAVRRDGVAGLRGAFSRAWAQTLCDDFATLFTEAQDIEGGTVSRGRERWYFAVHPERLHGFVDLVTHPAVTSLSEDLLGPDYEICEVAFDVPFPGAIHQPWHRDFEMPPETRDEGRLSSLAFNLTAVDVAPEMGPFEIAPGTQFDDGDAFAHGMFPPAAEYPRYEALSTRRLPQMGDASVRTGLAIHRGTPNRSARPRPVLVLGVVTPEVDTSGEHELHVTEAFYGALPADVRRRLRCTVVRELAPIVQRHTIEGLVMGE